MYISGMGRTNPAPSPKQDNNQEQVHKLANKIITKAGPPNPYKFARPHPLLPAGRAEMARARSYNREHPNTTLFTPRANAAANRFFNSHASVLDRIGRHSENFLQLKQLGQGLTQMFDPRTRAGLVSALSMFAPGARGEGYGSAPLPEDVLSEWQPGAFFTNYSGQGDPLSRGITHEGLPHQLRVGRKTGSWNDFGKTEKQILMNSLARRAEGVGGYRQANPLDVIEQQHLVNSGIRQTRDNIKEYSNRGGFISKRFNDARKNYLRMHESADTIMGSKLIPYRPKSEFQAQSRTDMQPHDYTDRMALINLHKQMPGNSILGAKDPVMRALYDMLFSGKGFFRAPRRP